MKKNAKNFNNFTNPTLLTGEDYIFVLAKVNVPELHCMIGKTYFKLFFFICNFKVSTPSLWVRQKSAGQIKRKDGCGWIST